MSVLRLRYNNENLVVGVVHEKPATKLGARVEVDSGKKIYLKRKVTYTYDPTTMKITEHVEFIGM